MFENDQIRTNNICKPSGIQLLKFKLWLGS